MTQVKCAVCGLPLGEKDRETPLCAKHWGHQEKVHDIGAANERQNEYWKRVGGRSPLRPPAEEDGNG